MMWGMIMVKSLKIASMRRTMVSGMAKEKLMEGIVVWLLFLLFIDIFVYLLLIIFINMVSFLFSNE